MSAEPQASLSVRVSAQTKRYLDALAEKKGVGVGRVIEQIVAELQDTPEQIYYLRFIARLIFVSNSAQYLSLRLSNQVQEVTDMADGIRAHMDKIFGPLPPAPTAFQNIDTSEEPDEIKAMYAAFKMLSKNHSEEAASQTAQSSSFSASYSEHDCSC